MRKIHVLIVEDDAFAAMDLAEFVSDTMPAIIVSALNIAQTKRALDEHFDVVFLDVNVTDGETFEIADLLIARGIPFSFLSGSKREDVPPRLRAVPFLAKPYDPASITKALRAIDVG